MLRAFDSSIELSEDLSYDLLCIEKVKFPDISIDSFFPKTREGEVDVYMAILDFFRTVAKNDVCDEWLLCFVMSEADFDIVIAREDWVDTKKIVFAGAEQLIYLLDELLECRSKVSSKHHRGASMASIVTVRRGKMPEKWMHRKNIEKRENICL